MTGDNSKALEFVRLLSSTEFWGSLTLKFEAGRIVHLKKEENLKPEELSGKPRTNNERRNNNR